MILTVTLNPALDKSMTIPGLAVNAVNRVQRVQLDPGGKGINVSKTVQALGGETMALGILGGAAGGYIKASLDQMSINNDFVFSANPTRTNLKLMDPVNGTTTDLNEEGSPADTETLQQVWEAISAHVQPGDVVVFAGKNPPLTSESLLAEWTRKLHRIGVKVAVDTVGKPLELVLRERPEIIKPNLRELSELLNCEMLTQEQAVEAASVLAKNGVELVVISLGDDGAVFASHDRVIRGFAPEVQAVCTVGAGDAMMAALAMGLEQGLSLEEIARTALAVSAAAVLQNGTQAVNAETAKRLAEQVRLQNI